MPYGRRAARRIDQMLGYPASGQRPGVILMLHVGRCGSTVLANLLDQNPAIYWDGKLHRQARVLYGDDLAEMDHEAWTRRQFMISGARYYGFEFKFLPDQYPAILGMTPQDFLDMSQRMGVTHYILLRRRNTLRHVVSNHASRNRGMWHSSSSDAVQRKAFEIDITRITSGSAPGRPLLQYLQEVEDAHAKTWDHIRDLNALQIDYETDIDENGAEFAYNKVCDFLDVVPSGVQIANKRLNPFPMSSTVRNFDEIAAVLRGTDFEWMLEDTPDPAGG
jgi:hypothetical protein